MTDPNPELGGASEGAEELELELELPEEEKTELGGDPLDAIQDEVARAEAKKARAIVRRQAKKPAVETKVEKPAETPSTEYLTKADFHKANERKAIREITADAEIKAVWSEIIPFYTPRRGKETAEDILEDLKDALTIYNARNPKTVSDDSAKTLTESAVVKTGGGQVDTKDTQKPKDPPNFKLPSQPKDWYKKSV